MVQVLNFYARLPGVELPSVRQVGFGLYPVIVKKFATENHADPLIFSFYRDLCCFPLLFLCALIAERKIMFPRIKMLVVCSIN